MSSVKEYSQPSRCHCKGSRSLDILKEVQKAYEDRLDYIERMGGAEKQELVTKTLRSWVNDLLSQNKLLVKTVEDLELEVTSRILLEARKHQEIILGMKTEMEWWKRLMMRAQNDCKSLVELLRRLRDPDNDDNCGKIKFLYVTEKDIYGAAWTKKGHEDGDNNSAATN